MTQSAVNTHEAAHRWLTEGIEHCSALEQRLSRHEGPLQLADLEGLVRPSIEHLLSPSWWSFAALDPDGLGFSVVTVEPPEAHGRAMDELSALLGGGRAAWWIEQERVVVTSASATAQELVVRALATPRAVFGMFLAEVDDLVPESAQHLLTLALGRATAALAIAQLDQSASPSPKSPMGGSEPLSTR